MTMANHISYRCGIVIAFFLLGIALAATLPGCSHAKDKAELKDPTSDASSRWGAVSDRLLATYLDSGYVVTRDQDGNARNQGDSLIFTGLAMSALDCAHGRPLSAALQSMVQTLRGGLWRHPSLPNAVSLDGALGFYLGVATRVKRCGERDEWRPLMATHMDASPFINRAGGIILEEPFTYVRDKLFASLDLAGEPDISRLRLLEKSAAVLGEAPHLARVTKLGSDACFRPHLALIALQTVEELGGEISGPGRDAFCAATKDYDLPTIDHWCGRGDLAAWTSSWQENQWQYRHQRCPAWERADGGGLLQPGVDELRGLVDTYRFMF